MPFILALILVAIVAVTVLSFTIHFLFSPWIFVAIAVIAWIKLRPRHRHQ